MSCGGKILNRGREKKRKILDKTEGRKKIRAEKTPLPETGGDIS
jgi:hypothetical protein